MDELLRDVAGPVVTAIMAATAAFLVATARKQYRSMLKKLENQRRGGQAPR